MVILTSALCTAPAVAQTHLPAGCSEVGTGKTHQVNRLRIKDDIDAIGVRNITGKRIGNWYSVEKEAKMGKQYADAVEENSELIRDAIVTEYINRVGQNLVRNSDARVPFIIKVIASADINAFALPGGHLYVNSGLILFAGDEAELAAVMAHEIAHVAARHATRQMTRSHMFSMASVPLVFVTGGAGLVLQEALDVATPLGTTKFSRSFEGEADYLGLEYAYKAGYDPQAFISFFERIQKLQKGRPNIVARAFSTHPETSDRVKRLQREIARILPQRAAYVVSTSEFDEVRSHLYELENGQKHNQESRQPTLKRQISSPPESPE
jgi:predicted Zn-dependent protease